MSTIPHNGESDVAARQGVGSLLLRWQCQHDPDDFAALVALVREPLERLAARTLRQGGIRDPGACDEAVSLALEQLCRLGIDPAAAEHADFEPDRLRASGGDSGWAYVRCVARSRARDVARAVRRRDRHAAGYAARAGPHAGTDDESAEAAIEQLRSAVGTLDERSRQVLGLLLDGKSQAVIAHVLGVCEGTVSRIRAEAISRLRAVLATRAAGD